MLSYSILRDKLYFEAFFIHHTSFANSASFDIKQLLLLEYRFLNVFCECSNKAFLESLIGDVNVVCFQRASFCWEGISLYLSYFSFHLCKLKKKKTSTKLTVFTLPWIVLSRLYSSNTSNTSNILLKLSVWCFYQTVYLSLKV